MKTAVLGAGAWGTALAINLSAGRDVRLWARDPQQVQAMHRERENRRYLPDCRFPDALRVEPAFDAAIHGAGVLILATPVSGLRALLQQIAAAGTAAPVIWLCKGFERPGALLPHEVFAAEKRTGARGAVLTGPSFAQEIAAGLPAALTLAAADGVWAAEMAQALHSPALRIYSHDDVTGAEVGGAVKNVMAIAAGVCDGLGLGLNARAALITRGLAEMTRFGVALGARAQTFMGLAGIGDLILTCTGDLSRNRRIGLALARGETADSTQSSLGHVAEGIYTAREVRRRARAIGVDMPITDAVCAVLDQPGSAAAVVRNLLARDPKAEHR